MACKLPPSDSLHLRSVFRLTAVALSPKGLFSICELVLATPAWVRLEEAAEVLEEAEVVVEAGEDSAPLPLKILGTLPHKDLCYINLEGERIMVGRS